MVEIHCYRQELYFKYRTDNGHWEVIKFWFANEVSNPRLPELGEHVHIDTTVGGIVINGVVTAIEHRFCGTNHFIEFVIEKYIPGNVS